MRKLFTLFMLLPLLTACEKDADVSQLDADFVVSTDFDIDADFGSYSTFYIPDSIMVITNRDEPEYWQANGADDVIQLISDRLTEAGYTRVTDKDQADLGIQPTFIKSIFHFLSYNNSPYWWWGFPGYWSPGFWGSWNSWRYPYIVRHSFRVGGLLVEMADLKEGRKDLEAPLPLVWTSYMTGLLSSSDRINVLLANRAVNQAFEQSPYINNK